ncbi:heavy metal translocating P-type ATPase [Balneola vulgaris]|uniref:heavy metal translocating P-type ATPase n=1 Tax=Balneola vulgaris TaxID=287535 RepID=UPI000360D9DF|nr:heavy metal translocating P-type ATPase [Balneola vulgaris]
MTSFIKKYYEAFTSALFLILALVVEHTLEFSNQSWVYFPLYAISYLAVGIHVWKKAFESIMKGNFYSEFMLMGIATVGAFAIGEYAEGVAVMLFYMVGEYTQHGAVHKARHSIKKLIDQQPDVATVERNGSELEIHPSKVKIGEVIRVKPGQKVPLDGKMLSDEGYLNTAALTGESKPVSLQKGESVWAGSINEDRPIRIEVTAAYQDSKLSNILHLVQEASQRKAPTQRFITRFAKVYTPIVVWLAVAVTFLPYFVVDTYVFEEWFYRALVFLVVSCPCGLVISVPLGYFGGIGAASRNGILLKGSDYLDQLRSLKALYLDKTGTLTEGTFDVQEVHTRNEYSQQQVMQYAATVEKESSHPIAKALTNFYGTGELLEVSSQEEVKGKGIIAQVGKDRIVLGNAALLSDHKIEIHENSNTKEAPVAQVFVAVNGEQAGLIVISDRIKEDSKSSIEALRKLGVERIVMLSGDAPKVAEYVGKQLGVDEALGGLLPEDKYNIVEKALNKDYKVGFVGDGVNDAPVITLADIGFAMGGIGSDATIETADVVIQTDQPSKIPLSIHIAKFTHQIVWQNIVFALSIKVGVMAWATFGTASMWAAIFADVGVALIAILNAIRVQSKFSNGHSLIASIKHNRKDYEDEENEASCCASGC